MSDSSPVLASPARQQRLFRFAKWAIGALLVFAILGFGVAPPVARHYGEQILGEKLGRAVSVERIGFNPFTLTAEAQGVRIMEADGQQEAFGVDLLRANLELESLIRGGPVLRELSIAGPRLVLVNEGDGRYNWSDVIERFPAGPDDEKPMSFSVGNIQLSNGRIVVEDKPKGRHHEVADLALGIPFVSNLPVKVDVFVEPSLSAKINGDVLQLTGRTKPFGETRETILDIALKDFELAPWLVYLPFEPAFSLPSGRLTTNLEVGFSQTEGPSPAVTLKGPIQISDLAVQDKNGQPALAVGELDLELGDVQPLANKWHFSRLRLIRPEVDLVRLADGGLNLLKLLPGAEGAAGKKAPPAKKAAQKNTQKDAQTTQPAPAQTPPPDFLLAQARIREGVLRYRDASLAKPFQAKAEAITLDLRDLANTGDMPAEIRLDYTLEGGGKFTHEDKLRLTPHLQAEGSASVEQLDLGRFAPYFAAALPSGELRSGQADVSLHYRLALGEGEPQLEITAEKLALRDFTLALAGAKEAAIRVPETAVREARFSLHERTVRIAEVGVTGAALASVRSQDGHFDLEALAGAPSGDTGASAPWSVNVGKLTLAGASARIEDRKTEKPLVFNADNIAFSAENLSTDKGSAAQVALNSRINRKGKLDARGTVQLEPLRLGLEVDVDGIDLPQIQPYALELAKISISRGTLGAKGALELAQEENAPLQGRFRGNLDVANFASVDKLNSTDFVRWRTFGLAGVDLQLEPFSLGIDTVTLADFRTRLILNDQGRLNLREIGPDTQAVPSAQAESAPAAADTPAEMPPIRIGAIRFKNGNIAFSDRFIRPNYDANLTGMNGTLSGLSSDPSTIARLDLEGKVANAAPVSIKGEFNPFRQDRYLDIVMAVKDFELTDLSSYAGKYVGYGIQKGKLSADLNYKIENRHLTAENRVFLNQLTFGEKVDSPDAVNLPVQLAVSLLKNSRGEITLNLPVSGTLDDPQFSIFGLVVEALVNLIGKAVTAPFGLLGAVFEGGQEMSFVDFAPGISRVGDEQAEKMDALARALKDRPGLHLEITGHADPASDIDGLKRAQLDRQIRAAKRKNLREQDGESRESGKELPPARQIEISEAEYATLLEQIYDDADFEKPRNFFGLTKDVPVAEMETRMLEHITVDDEAFRALAQKRAQAARQWLLEKGQVPSEQIFLLPPAVGAAPEGEGRRVLFSLR